MTASLPGRPRRSPPTPTDAIDLVSPDVVVPDYLLFGSILAAEAARLPVVPIVPNIWTLPSPGVPAIGPGFPLAKGLPGRCRDSALRAMVNALFRRGLPPLNAARTARGLPPLHSFYDQVLDTSRILVLTSPSFDFASPSVPANVRYTGADPRRAGVGRAVDRPGPTDHGRSAGARRVQLDLPGARPRSCSGSSMGCRRCRCAGSSPSVRRFTAGDVTPSHNVEVIQSAPHGPILREASLAITHCGHGTVMKALAHGVPMVCIPMGRDQNDTAARVVHHGAGVRLSPRSSAARIAAAVREVLDDPRFRENAQRMSRAIAEEARTTDVVAELEAVVNRNGTTATALESR